MVKNLPDSTVLFAASTRTATVGGVVPGGATIMEIVPVGQRVLVEARIKPKDVGFVRVGFSGGAPWASTARWSDWSTSTPRSFIVFISSSVNQPALTECSSGVVFGGASPRGRT